MRDAAELRQRAQVAARAGRTSDARTLLAQARKRAEGDADMLALIRTTSAYIDAEQFGAQTGVTACLALLETDGLGSTTRGTIWSQLGLLHMRAGEREKALDCYSEAIPLLRDAPETLGRAYMNRANIHLYLSAPSAAVEDLTVAMAEFDRAGNAEERGKVEHNIGYAHLLLGDLVTALQWMDRAVATLSPVPLVLQSVMAQDRAEVLLAAGRVDDALEALHSAAAACGAQRLRRFQAEAEFVLARTLLHEDPARARTVAKASARRFRQHGSTIWADRADALAIIAMIDAGARTMTVRDHADQVSAQLRRHGHHRDADQLALHVVRLVIGRRELDDATARLRRIRVDDDTPIGTRLLAREVRAELARAKGQRGRALGHVRAGLADLHSWRASFGSLDLQSTIVGQGNSLARLGLQLALGDGRPDVVFEWSERARALASKVTTLRPPPDPQLAADLTELRLLDPAHTARARELRERIRSQSWYAAEGSVGEPASLGRLQQRLRRDDAALIAHIALDDRITALVVTGDDVAVAALGNADAVRGQLDRIAADLDFAAHHPDGAFGATVRASLDEDLAAVADELVTPCSGCWARNASS